MAIPIYIICSRGVSHDRNTGLYSIFEVIDKLILSELPKPEKDTAIIIERQPLIISSSWQIDTQNGEKYEDEFEFSLKSYMDGSSDAVMLQDGVFKFVGPEMPAHRFTFNFMGPLPIKNSGVLFIENKVRKKGSPSWKQHSYRLIVEIANLKTPKTDTDK